MGGHALAKKKFSYPNLLSWMVLRSMMVPNWVTIISLYILVARLDPLILTRG